MIPASFKYKLFSPSGNEFQTVINLPQKYAEKFFNDGRIMGRFAEFLVASKNIGNRSGNENTSYDNVTIGGERIEVRAITKHGVSFAASSEVGCGRKVTVAGFNNKLDNVDYWCLVDYNNFDECKFYFLTNNNVASMESLGLLTKEKRVSYKKILKYLSSL